MGTEYKPIGGIGIEIDGEMERSILNKKYFTLEELKDDPETCIGDIIGETYSTIRVACDNFTSNYTIYIMVNGNNIIDVINNSHHLLKSLKDSFSINKEMEDLIVIEDLFIF